jgi:hypothetical protein
MAQAKVDEARSVPIGRLDATKKIDDIDGKIDAKIREDRYYATYSLAVLKLTDQPHVWIRVAHSWKLES